jgi:predicted glutamine amidotransferase
VRTGRRENVAFVSSEPLTTGDNEWVPVPPMSSVVITRDMDVLVVPLSIAT